MELWLLNKKKMHSEQKKQKCIYCIFCINAIGVILPYFLVSNFQIFLKLISYFMGTDCSISCSKKRKKKKERAVFSLHIAKVGAKFTFFLLQNIFAVIQLHFFKRNLCSFVFQNFNYLISAYSPEHSFYQPWRILHS